MNLTRDQISGHALRGKAGGAFGPDLAKKLSQLVKMEKNVMRSLETVARERMEVAVCLPMISRQYFAIDMFNSNNYPFGVRLVTKMSLTSPTS